MIIAATGHRPNKLGGYNPETTIAARELATEYLIEAKPSLVISGMAQGWDTAIAQAAYNLNIPFHAYIPFVGQELPWPSAAKLYYKALLEKAEQVVVCSPGGFTKAAMQVRNQRMVDACDGLVALWDGSSGGTANCISYATYMEKPITNLWDKYLIRRNLA